MRKVVSSNPGTAEEEEEEEGEEGEENKSFKDKEQGIIVHIHLGGLPGVHGQPGLRRKF